MTRARLEILIDPGEHHDFREFLSILAMDERPFLLRNDLLLAFREYCEREDKGENFLEYSSIRQFLSRVQELFRREEHFVIMHRYMIARYRFYRLRTDGDCVEEIGVGEYLDFKDRCFGEGDAQSGHLHIDFLPFYEYAPFIRDTRSVGHGIRYLNRYMSSNIFQNREQWAQKAFEFIQIHKYREQQLLVNGAIIKSAGDFFAELEEMIVWLANKEEEADHHMVEEHMRRAGFEPGWGHTVGRIRETMQMLVDLVNEPTDMGLAEFISRVPMPLISKIAIISPHGWFGQENVLGRPDTGGQVIYILDQVRALERHLKTEIALLGLDVQPHIIVVTRLIPEAEGTTCDQRREKIHGTDNGWIVRVPFEDAEHHVVPNWISRFHVWPYLDRFAEAAAVELGNELQGRPDLIIGNYSDGNLVATLLSERLDVIQCTIAHALEKTKYLFSDLYWQDMEEEYNFSLQYTADILSMNRADFVITSTHQEIIGTEDVMGQYESYQMFTLPGLFQVLSGVNLFAPKFNVIPPGVDEDLYFPFWEREPRIEHRRQQWVERLFLEENNDVCGRLEDPEKIPIFTMARLDHIKNITGLIEAFGMSASLRERCNLIVAAGTIHEHQSQDREEQEEIRRVYGLMDQYALHGHMRWLPSINKLDTGEVYRIIADRGGVFVQPALFEAFGLTILEAMLSGLPTFAPKFGGPLEIIEDGISGFLVNTSQPRLIADDIEEFWTRCDEDAEYWESVSLAGVERVRTAFTWRLYSERLISLTKLYGFWRYSVTQQGKLPMKRYAEFVYHCLFLNRCRQKDASTGE